MGEPIRLGVLGTADIATRRTLPAVADCPDLRLVAVASRDTDRAGEVARRFGADPVAGYEALLQRSDVDAVYIPLPNALHERWSAAALDAGKHVLVEKSLTVRACAARELVGIAAARGLAFVENFAFLHHPQHAAVRDLVAAGFIGEPRVLSASFGIPPADRGLIRYRADLAGGALRETGCYPVRTALLHLGPDVRVLGAHLRVDAARGVDVAGSALLVDAAGTTAQCDFGFEHGYRNTYAIWGSAGRVELDWAYTPPPAHRPVLRLHHGDVREERLLPAADQFRVAVAAFAAACADPAAHRDTGAAAVAQAALLESIIDHAGGTDA